MNLILFLQSYFLLKAILMLLKSEVCLKELIKVYENCKLVKKNSTTNAMLKNYTP